MPVLFAASMLLAAASDSPPSFTIAQIVAVPKSGTIIGARRSGLLCTPAGRVYWRDVAPAEDHLKRNLAVAMTSAGMTTKVPSADDFDREVRTRYRITVTILRAEVNVCVPWRGLRVGAQRRAKATGRLVTLWRVFDQKARLLVAKARVCVSLSNREDGAAGASPVDTGMARAAADFAANYRAIDATASEQMIGCSIAEDQVPTEE